MKYRILIFHTQARFWFFIFIFAFPLNSYWHHSNYTSFFKIHPWHDRRNLSLVLQNAQGIENCLRTISFSRLSFLFTMKRIIYLRHIKIRCKVHGRITDFLNGVFLFFQFVCYLRYVFSLYYFLDNLQILFYLQSSSVRTV